MANRLVVKVTCGTDDPERCEPGVHGGRRRGRRRRPGVAVADRRGGLVRGPGRGAELALPQATPVADLLAAVLAAAR